MSEHQSATHAMDARLEEKAKAKATLPVASLPTTTPATEKIPSKKETKPEAKGKGILLGLEDFGYVKYPLMTEKAITLIEKENKISFVATEKATKQDIRSIVEKVYHVKVGKINVVNDMKGRKKVTVKLLPPHKAEELAAKLGVI